MTKNELKQATELALSDKDIPLVSGVFEGFGLPDFQPVYCTLSQLAALIRWQAVQLNGQLAMEAYNELARHGRKRFQIIG